MSFFLFVSTVNTVADTHQGWIIVRDGKYFITHNKSQGPEDPMHGGSLDLSSHMPKGPDLKYALGPYVYLGVFSFFVLAPKLAGLGI